MERCGGCHYKSESRSLESGRHLELPRGCRGRLSIVNSQHQQQLAEVKHRLFFSLKEFRPPNSLFAIRDRELTSTLETFVSRNYDSAKTIPRPEVQRFCTFTRLCIYRKHHQHRWSAQTIVAERAEFIGNVTGISLRR